MNNKNELGTITIKDKAIKEIVSIVIKKTKFVRPAKKDLAYIDVTTKSNNISLDINVKVKEGKDIIKVTSAVQKNIKAKLVCILSLIHCFLITFMQVQMFC